MGKTTEHWTRRVTAAIGLDDVLALPRRQLWLLSLPLLLIGAWGPWAEYGRWRQANARAAQQAGDAARKLATQAAERLQEQIDTLRLAAATLQDARAQLPLAQAMQRLRDDLTRARGIAAFGLVSPDGKTLQWIDQRGVHIGAPTAAARFSTLAAHPGLMLGPQIRSRDGAHDLLLRLRLRGARAGFELGAAVPTTSLLAGAPGAPWSARLASADSTPGVEDGSGGVSAPVPGFALRVALRWPQALARQAYWRQAPPRWGFELATMLLLAGVVWRIAALLGAQRRLAAMQSTLLDNALVGIALATNRHVLRANQRFAQMLGYADARQLDGASFRVAYASDDEYNRVGTSYAQLRAEGSAFVQAVHMRRRDGSVLIADLAGKIVSDARTRDASTTVWAFLDVTERHTMQARFEHLATHDSMTGLPNRLALEQQLVQALARAERNGDALAVGVIDLDDFKPVNDRWGHEAGDALLQQVAQRFNSVRRHSDMIARLGGDEFAIVLEGLDPRGAREQLGVIARRLHGVVESPFDLGDGHRAEVGMTMGLALFPADAADGDALLRLADAAMYRAKANKAKRTQWWQCSSAPSDAEAPEAPFDPYGADARALLAGAQPGLQAMSSGFVEDFYSRLGEARVTGPILHALGHSDMRALRAAQAAHLRFLLDPSTDAAMIARRAEHLGRAHALVGIDAATMVESMSLYRELCAAHFRALALPTRSRYHLTLAIERRLLDDVQAELRSLEQTTGQYQSAIVAPLPAPGALWADVAASELELLTALPGMLACAALRPDVQGVFQIESLAGHEPLGALLRQTMLAQPLEGAQTQGGSLVATAWRSGRIARGGEALDAAATAGLRDALAAHGVRSMAAIPVAPDAHRADMVLLLLGAFPRQFEAAPMEPFLQGLQRRWRELRATRLRRLPSAVLQRDLAQSWRERLFSGGLEMHVQPIIDLRTGALRKVEALARLRQPDGSLVSPALFLPLLGNAELDRLFRLGLQQSLGFVREWDDQGLSVDLSVNLPPSTLLAPDCARWIDEALTASAVAPQRLALELLESDAFDDSTLVEAIGRLQPLGVRLAMDDLGAGYSSLKRLFTLPFDTLKVDQGVTAQLRAQPLDTLRLIATLIQVGHDMRRAVVVEGLEDSGMVEAARELGAQQGQGYAWSPPLPAAELPRWAARWRPQGLRTTPRTPLGRLARQLRPARRDAPASALQQLVRQVVEEGGSTRRRPPAA